MNSLHPLYGIGIWLLAASLVYAQSFDPNFGPPPLEPTPQDPTPQDPSATYDSLPHEPLDSSPLEPLPTDVGLLTEVEADCEPVPVYSTRLAIDLTLADFEINDGTTEYWSTEPSGVTRFEFAIENPEGLGVRLQSWSLEENWELDDGPLEIRVSTFYLDAFQRYVGDHGELLLGGGLAVGTLKVDSPFDNTVHRFNGLGGSLGGEGFFPFLRFAKTDVGVTGRARFAVLGPLDDNFGDSQAMLVDELGIGLELRRRFGQHEDKMWFVRFGREYQLWTDIDSPFTLDQRIEATSLTLGVAW